MYLSAKTALLTFWIFCIICETFAPRHESEFTSSSEDDGSASASSSEDVDDYSEEYYRYGERVSRRDFMKFYRQLKGHGYNNEEIMRKYVAHKSASASSSQDNSRCVVAIKQVFTYSEAIHNLKLGFYSWNETKFVANDDGHEYKYGYYKDLVDRATELESSNISSPQDFCEQEFRDFQGVCVVNIRKIEGIEGDTSGLEAYKIMYFKLDLVLISLDKFFPGWAPDKNQYNDHVAYYQAFNEAVEIHDGQLQFIHKYFDYLYHQSENLNIENLRTPQQYCQQVFPE